MSYKTILVHVDPSRHTPDRVALAAGLARRFDAHLIGASMNGVSRFVFDDAGAGIALQMLAAQVEALAEQSRTSLDRFTNQVQRADVRSYEARMVNDEPEGGLVLQARYADLLVVGQPDPEETAFTVVGDLPDYVMLNCGRPVLVVPYAGSAEAVGNRILVAWDGGMPATRAITAALPLLKSAQAVTLAVFDPRRVYDQHGDQPGADMALYLARHGVRVEVVEQAAGADVGSALLNLAAETRTDLLVMGGYGHSRFREIVLGGATDTILNSMTLPVLMAH
jgi:nucleotide-binding universal stress UspA family protein